MNVLSRGRSHGVGQSGIKGRKSLLIPISDETEDHNNVWIKNSINRRGENQIMPEISLFYGIRITMCWSDHNPPHFYAEYGNNSKAMVLIEEGIISEGYLPKRQLKFVLAWAEIHQDELMQNWELSKDNKPLNRINPLI